MKDREFEAYLASFYAEEVKENKIKYTKFENKDKIRINLN